MSAEAASAPAQGAVAAADNPELKAAVAQQRPNPYCNATFQKRTVDDVIGDIEGARICRPLCQLLARSIPFRGLAVGSFTLLILWAALPGSWTVAGIAPGLHTCMLRVLYGKFQIQKAQ